MTKPVKTIADLQPDPRNLNKHTQRGGGMAVRSVQECGLGRSIVVDKNGVIIGGNQITETVSELGIEEIHVVPSDGRKLVVVQRTDLDLGAVDDDRARRLAVFDNRVSEVNLDWNIDEITALRDGGMNFDGLWSQKELNELLKSIDDGVPDAPAPEQTLSEKYMIVVECRDEGAQRELLTRFLAEGLDCKALCA